LELAMEWYRHVLGVKAGVVAAVQRAI
jgi:hypothetical protein